MGQFYQSNRIELLFSAPQDYILARMQSITSTIDLESVIIADHFSGIHICHFSDNSFLQITVLASISIIDYVVY